MEKFDSLEAKYILFGNNTYEEDRYYYFYIIKQLCMKNEIILFENQKIKLEVNMKDETVWLNVNQMAILFERDYKTIRKHINNVLEEELKRDTVVAKFANTTEHGAIKEKTQTHMIDYYSLDVVIGVGYRVKSQNGIIFRR